MGLKSSSKVEFLYIRSGNIQPDLIKKLDEDWMCVGKEKRLQQTGTGIVHSKEFFYLGLKTDT